MYKILKLNEIAPIINNYLPADKYTIGKDIASPDAILIRSADMHEFKFEDNLLAIARAGAGINNIPVDKCSELGIAVFNTPGANANSVKELLICSMIVMSRNLVPAVVWTGTLKNGSEPVAKLVEKGKKQFVGPELKGKTLGVIGLGAIGNMVANDAHALGMEVLGYDPYITVENAWRLSRGVRRCTSLDQLYTESDYITIHIPLMESTRGYLDKAAFDKMKKGVRILNFARSELVNIPDLIAALESGHVAGYATDFPTEELIGRENVLAIPHLGASTPEAEDNCAAMAAQQLADYLETGTIKNSVNFPDCELPHTGKYRLTVFHLNIANMVSQITNALAGAGINISGMINKSKDMYAYTVIDLDEEPDEKILKKISEIESVIRVRPVNI
ncbi:MAG TPA: phosphoglycerate dehydrogenase [Clostridia bacterium]|nr:phosphoglycerate dehydrogenase [Clostridia bacterium]